LQTKLTCFWEEPAVHCRYRAAVSLHGHTNHSQEGLSFIPKFIARHSVLSMALAAQKRRAVKRAAIEVNFAKAYWTPPLPPFAAFQLELDQIRSVLGLDGMVSLTDHDNIGAPLLLRVLPKGRELPISVEWSVPYRGTVLHLGIHNLPSSEAEDMMTQMGEYTNRGTPARLHEILEALDRRPEVLIILNHPLWDLTGIGRSRHERLVRDFSAELGIFIHALELSGVRRWEENYAVVELAEAWNQLVVGGGDRHGAEPNAVLNLTDACTFSEFVDEVRRQRRSHVLFMPQYAQPFTLRVLRSLLDIVRDYPDYPSGTRRWDERVFHPDRHGEQRPLASLWRRPPVYVEAFFALVRLLEVPVFRSAIEAMFAKPNQLFHFSGNRKQEAKSLWSATYASRTFQTHSTKSTVWPTPAASLRRSRENAEFPS
jgi:hypothetical protein